MFLGFCSYGSSCDRTERMHRYPAMRSCLLDSQHCILPGSCNSGSLQLDRSFHRHPFLQMKDNAERVRELRATNWNFGFHGESKDWIGTNHRTFDEGPGSAVYPEGVKRRF